MDLFIQPFVTSCSLTLIEIHPFLTDLCGWLTPMPTSGDYGSFQATCSCFASPVHFFRLKALPGAVVLNSEPLDDVDKFKYLGLIFVANGPGT